jgi:hypothetical protein
MNQSVQIIKNLVSYRESHAAEAYETLRARLEHVRPQLCKIYSDGYITTRPTDGSAPERVHIKLLLTADKSGMAHMLGRKSINYDAFGLQCDCCDSADELFDLQKPPMSHFDAVTFEIRCGRAHVPLWEALELPEPPDWTVYCNCCKKVRAPLRAQPRAQPRARPSVGLPTPARPFADVLED